MEKEKEAKIQEAKREEKGNVSSLCDKNTDTEKELYKHTRKSLWATFEREYKRTVDLFLCENKEYTKQMATKELKAVYSIKRNQYVIYKRKDYENKLNEYRKRGCK